MSYFTLCEEGITKCVCRWYVALIEPRYGAPLRRSAGRPDRPPPLKLDQRFESAFLQHRVCEPSVPRNFLVGSERLKRIHAYAERHPTDTGNIAAQALGCSVEVVKAALANPGAQQDRLR